MTKRQLRSMLIDEGLYYAGSTLLSSYILGALAVGIGVRMMVSTDWTATFHFTLLPLVICTPILIVFAILIPYICFKNLEKQSIVERLRQLINGFSNSQQLRARSCSKHRGHHATGIYRLLIAGYQYQSPYK